MSLWHTALIFITLSLMGAGLAIVLWLIGWAAQPKKIDPESAPVKPVQARLAELEALRSQGAIIMRIEPRNRS